MRSIALLLAVALAGCAPHRTPPRDPLPVELQRARISKVRHAIDETRHTLASAPEDAPWRAELTLRLAELLTEEARYHWLVAQEREGGEQERLHVPQVRLLKEQAIATARQLLVSFPDATVADRARFLIAEELRDLGDDEAMRATLLQLVREYPDSPLVPEAQLRLGRYAFEHNDLVGASTAYNAVLSSPSEGLHPLAWYRLGWVRVNQADCPKALAAFERATDARPQRNVTSSRSTPTAEGFALPGLKVEATSANVDVSREALVDAVWCATQVMKPEQVMDWLEVHARNREAYVAGLSKLGRRFAMIEAPAGAAAVARQLLDLGPDDEDRLEDARLLHHSVGRTRDYRRVDTDVTLVLEAFGRATVGPRVDADRAARLRQESQSLTRDLALRADRQRRGQGDIDEQVEASATPAAVARAYDAWLRSFPEGEQHVEIRLNRAESLADAGQWVDAGHQYRDAAEALLVRSEEGDAPLRLQALLDAVVSYEQALDGSLPRVDRAASRAGLREAGARFLAGGGGTDAEQRRVAFAIARSHYDDGDLERGRDLLAAVALGWPRTDEGDTAARLALDAARAQDDIAGLMALGRRLQDPASGVSATVQGELGPLLAAVEQRQLDTLALDAAGAEGSLEGLLEFVERYEDTDLAERALLGAFVAARAAGEHTKLEELGRQILKRFPTSEQAPGVASSLGRAAAARWDLDAAISWLEQAGQVQQGQEATASWVAAAALRSDLGDQLGASRDLEKALAATPNDRDAQRSLGDLLLSGAVTLASIEGRLDTAHPALQARYGYALVRGGQVDQGEMWLRRAMASPNAGPDTMAVAHYGLAERLAGDINNIEPIDDLAVMDELIATTDLAIQSYLESARLPDPRFSQAAMARLAHVAEVSAARLRTWPLPAELGEADRQLLRGALESRAQELESAKDEVMSQCGSRAREAWRYDAAGVACLKRQPPPKDVLTFDPPTRRTPATIDPALREAVANSPRKPEALQRLGQALVEGNDPRLATLVLQAAVSAGAGTEALMQLGQAHTAAGDTLGALAAWGRALDAGDARAQDQVDRVLASLGLSGLQASPQEGP